MNEGKIRSRGHTATSYHRPVRRELHGRNTSLVPPHHKLLPVDQLLWLPRRRRRSLYRRHARCFDRLVDHRGVTPAVITCAAAISPFSLSSSAGTPASAFAPVRTSAPASPSDWGPASISTLTATSASAPTPASASASAPSPPPPFFFTPHSRSTLTPHPSLPTPSPAPTPTPHIPVPISVPFPPPKRSHIISTQLVRALFSSIVGLLTAALWAAGGV